MNLTSLAAVKAYAFSNVPGATQSSNDDALITFLIRQASQAILNFIERPNLAKNLYIEAHNGTGGNFVMLREWPVLSIKSLYINSQLVTAQSQPGAAGYILEGASPTICGKPQAVYLNSYAFERGLQNIAFNYYAGYSVVNEPASVPAASQYVVTALQPSGNWCQDDGVTYATGAAFVRVAASPAQGQYSVAAGVYTFNAADVNAAVLISYSYVPADIEQACIETVVERYKYKNRVGQKSVGITQQTTSYDNTGLNEYSRMMLMPYRRAFPL